MFLHLMNLYAYIFTAQKEIVYFQNIKTIKIFSVKKEILKIIVLRYTI